MQKLLYRYNIINLRDWQFNLNHHFLKATLLVYSRNTVAAHIWDFSCHCERGNRLWNIGQIIISCKTYTNCGHSILMNTNSYPKMWHRPGKRWFMWQRLIELRLIQNKSDLEWLSYLFTFQKHFWRNILGLENFPLMNLRFNNSNQSSYNIVG